MNYQRIFLVIIDSLGNGAVPDAGRYNSLGADTLGHVGAHFRRRLQLPLFQRLGLGALRNQRPLLGISSHHPLGYYGDLQPLSRGISNRESQWEMMGLPTLTEADILPRGLPQTITERIKSLSRRTVIGNQLISTPQALANYGELQSATGGLLIYTTADSTLWLAAHEITMKMTELRLLCQQVRQFLDQSELTIPRVNGLLFTGNNPLSYYPCDYCTYEMTPPRQTSLGKLVDRGLTVMTIGKTTNLFPDQEVSHGYLDQGDLKNVEQLLKVMQADFSGVVVTDLSDLGKLAGHRRDPERFGQSLMILDHHLEAVVAKLQATDLLLITGNHGNDPTYPGDAHTRELVPLFTYSPVMKASGQLSSDLTLADIGATILDNFKLSPLEGYSFLNQLK